MQKVTVKSVITKPTKKEGTNITTIEDEKGAKMSAFNDDALAKVHTGDILEVEISIDGKYTNITGWKLLESKPRPPQDKVIEGPGKPPFADTRELSIEAQVAYKGIMENWEKDIPESMKLAAIRWGLSKLGIKELPNILQAPEKPEHKEVVKPAQQEAPLPATEGNSPIVAEIQRLLDTLMWKPATWRSWIKMQRWDGADTTGTLAEVLAKCNPNQINMFANHLKELIESKAYRDHTSPY